MTRTVSAVPGRELVGRGAEREHLSAFVSSVAYGPRALLLRGEPGIGKTMLWRDGVQRCREAEFTVLVTRPAEEDMPVPLVGLVDLFERDELDTDALRARHDQLRLRRPDDGPSASRR